MTSGHEKRVCGVDPNKGWNTLRERRRWHLHAERATLIAGWALALFTVWSFVSGLGH